MTKNTMPDRTEDKTGIGPCDRCGSDDDCRCGPCQCKWCRFDRGEATELEAAGIRRYRQERERAILREGGAALAKMDGGAG